MRIQLSDHFTYRRIFRFTLPSILMMIFSSVYGVVDGFFVSNFAGKVPFAAVNFIMPVLIVLGAFGFMFGTGGSALVSKTMGEGDKEEASRLFSLIVYASMITGVVISIVGICCMRPIAVALGAEGEMLEYCVQYGVINMAFIPAFMLQMEFQSFYITAEKPQLGLYTTLAAGITNMVLDALFIGVFRWGVTGAAVATGMSQLIGGLIPLMYFARPNNSLLRLTKTRFNGWALFKTCTNGSSELLSNAAMSLVGMLYNIYLLRYAGENGVAAYGVLMYVGMIFSAIFVGYSVGIAPVVSYHYGAQNHRELQSILRKCTVITGGVSVSMTLASFLLAKPLSSLFVGYDETLCALTLHAFSMYSYSFLFQGLAIFGSCFFTALNNGAVSAMISFLRTLVFQAGAIILLPLVLGTDGLWWSITVAELAAFLLTALFLKLMQKKYHY